MMQRPKHLTASLMPFVRNDTLLFWYPLKSGEEILTVSQTSHVKVAL
jgi:hypothetical protein